MSTMTLWAMVDNSGHVCRDEDGKVVYDRIDHPSLDVRRFDMRRPQSKPHRVVRFDAHLAAREADSVPFDIEAAASEFIEEGCEGKSGTAYPSKLDAWFITQFANSLPALYAAPVAQEDAAPANRIPCPECNGDKGHLGGNLGYVPCRDCDGSGFIESDEYEAAAPAEQVVGDGLIGYVHPALLDGNSLAMEVSRVRLSDAQLPVYTAPRPAVAAHAEQVAGDEWHKVGHIERSALARLMEGSKGAETLFVIGGGCQPHDVYVKLPAAAPNLSDRYRAVMEAQGGVTDSDLHQAAPDRHHDIARSVWEQMDRRSAPGIIMSMTYTAVLRALAAHPHTGHSAVTDTYTPTDDEVRDWLTRSDIDDSRIDHWRTVIDDARSMHLLAAAPEVDRD